MSALFFVDYSRRPETVLLHVSHRLYSQLYVLMDAFNRLSSTVRSGCLLAELRKFLPVKVLCVMLIQLAGQSRRYTKRDNSVFMRRTEYGIVDQVNILLISC